MSAIIYKQTFKAVNKTETPSKNSEHIRYIGTRPGAIKSPDQKHGLFGNLYDSQSLEVNCKIKDVMDLVRQKSIERKNIFRAVLSFSPEDAAKKLGYPISQEAWRELVRQNVEIIAKENKIRMSDLKWTAAAHDTPTHPHVHIVFWDEGQEIIKNYVNPQVPNETRINLTKNIFQDEIKEYYEAKSNAEVLLKDITKEMTIDFEQYLSGMSEQDYKLYTSAYNDNSMSIDENMCQYVGTKLYELRLQIPKGSLKFEYLKPDVKNELVELVRELIDNNDSLQEAIQEYINSRLGIAKFYDTDEYKLDMLAEEYTNEAEKKIANALLRLMKKFNDKEWDIISAKYNDRLRSQMTERILVEIVTTFSRLTKENNKYIKSGKRNTLTGGLSKQAKKEKAKEMESTGWDVSR